ncbi:MULTISPECIES: transcription elongation factor subunit Spt4 [Methanohalophilus]|jgi:DNA-directed RNA polymerase subunit E"|uniref:Transcription elongation factor Spt4 n=4 Tax=Methanohalophilus TaxID=2175 RepID=A0A314ZXE4_9EURY|nr:MULTISPECIES: transcription elongation factor subunit Spt4 [Methanohalophilus]APH38191.1 DNA-directed RNA polymerase subunit E'' [Methanohalophilus halophilus]ATU08622.1 DNA-directed RNA polymerase subunit E'' [Methanohalophilus portucalensis]OJH49995.1 DNA-directed RNA polymerase, subunit E'' [Methanohalophilus portucalensis FDF-1]PQV41868.1 DNA-directed RNA polymerase subunit E'' [Methanohalophilus euhalobius]RNI10942.1 DNA-directed RNA polymerase, subunit E'' [Methanohalophilus halophilu
MVESVCMDCHRLVAGQECPVCGTTNLSNDWSGLLVIVDPEKSEIAKKIGVTIPDKYALKVR